jgi:hypothetical protein
MAKVNKSTHPASDVRGAGTPRRLPTGARSTASAIRPTALQPTSARGWAAQEASRSRTQHADVARPPAAARGDHARGTRHFTRHSSSVRRGVAMHPWWHHQRQPWEESTAVQMAHSSVTIRGRNRPRARASRPKTSRPGRPEDAAKLPVYTSSLATPWIGSRRLTSQVNSVHTYEVACGQV